MLSWDWLLLDLLFMRGVGYKLNEPSTKSSILCIYTHDTLGSRWALWSYNLVAGLFNARPWKVCLICIRERRMKSILGWGKQRGKFLISGSIGECMMYVCTYDMYHMVVVSTKHTLLQEISSPRQSFSISIPVWHDVQESNWVERRQNEEVWTEVEL